MPPLGGGETPDIARAAVYVALILACARCWRVADGAAARSLCVVVSSVSFAIALAELADFGKAITDQGRILAGTRGWYGDRRPLQAAAIAVLALAAGVTSIGGWFVVGRFAPGMRMMFVFFVMLVGFVAVREISLHQVDAVLNRKPLGELRLGILVELLLAALLAVVVFLLSVRPRRS